MRVLSKRGFALFGAIAMAATLSACAAGEDNAAPPAGATVPSAPAAAAASEAPAIDKGAETVGSIDAMVAALQKKNYACKDWEQTDDVAEAAASGTCNGEDSIMVFADNEGVQDLTEKLRDDGRSFVHGENWIVADTVTPTFVRNALGGTAVAAGDAQ